MTPVGNELDRVFFLRELRARMRLYLRALVRTHLDPREFACMHMHKWKRSFLRAFACVHLRAFACVLSRRFNYIANVFARKKSQNSTHFGFRNFQDVLYVRIVH